MAARHARTATRTSVEGVIKFFFNIEAARNTNKNSSGKLSRIGIACPCAFLPSCPLSVRTPNPKTKKYKDKKFAMTVADSPVHESAPSASNATTAPSTASTAPPYAPAKRLLTRHDLQQFHAHPAYASLLQFLAHLCAACDGRPCSVAMPPSRNVARLLALLDAVDALVGAHPPYDHADSRFGNLAFRQWYDAMDVVSACAQCTVLDTAADCDDGA